MQEAETEEQEQQPHGATGSWWTEETPQGPMLERVKRGSVEALSVVVVRGLRPGEITSRAVGWSVEGREAVAGEVLAAVAVEDRAAAATRRWDLRRRHAYAAREETTIRREPRERSPSDPHN